MRVPPTSLRYPPAVALINVVVKGRTLDAAHGRRARIWSTRVAHGTAARPGPRPGAGRRSAKVKDEYRAQFFLKGTQRTRDARRR